MKLHKCDVCGAEVGEYDLRTLLPDLQTEGMEHCCNDCHGEISDILIKIEDVLAAVKPPFLHRALRKLRDKLLPDGPIMDKAKAPPEGEDD